MSIKQHFGFDVGQIYELISCLFVCLLSPTWKVPKVRAQSEQILLLNVTVNVDFNEEEEEKKQVGKTNIFYSSKSQQVNCITRQCNL